MKALCWNRSGNLLVENISGKRTWNPDDAIVRFMQSSIRNTDLAIFQQMISAKHAGNFNGRHDDRDGKGTGSAIQNEAQHACAKVGSIIGCGVCSYCMAEYCPHHDSSEAIIPESSYRLIARGIFG